MRPQTSLEPGLNLHRCGAGGALPCFSHAKRVQTQCRRAPAARTPKNISAFAPALIAAKPQKPCDRGVFRAFYLLLKKESKTPCPGCIRLAWALFAISSPGQLALPATLAAAAGRRSAKSRRTGRAGAGGGGVMNGRRANWREMAQPVAQGRDGSKRGANSKPKKRLYRTIFRAWVLSNGERTDGDGKAQACFPGGLHEAARVGQTRPWSGPLAWLAPPKKALIH